MEILKNGTQRLRSEQCTFLMQRIEPGVLLTSMRGRDTDRFGDAPLRRVEAEYTHFGKPVRWLIDAHGIQNAAAPALDRWSKWLLDNRSRLECIEVLVDSDPAHLTIAIGRHLSATEELMRLHRDRSTFTCQPAPEGLFTEPAVPMAREQSPAGVVRLLTPGSTFHFAPAGRIIRSAITGDDFGQFGDAPFEEMERILGSHEGPFRWYLDATAAGYVAKSVREAWAAWMFSHRSAFEHVGILTAPGTVSLIVDLAKESSRTGDLMQRYTDPAAFERAAHAR